MRHRVLPIGFSAVLLLALMFTPQAYATPTLSFQVDGGGTTTCADGALCDANATVGVVTFVGALGAFTVNVTTGITKPVFDGSHMDLNSVNIQVGSGAHTLVMMFSETDFQGVSMPPAASFGGTLSGGATITASAYFDDSDAGANLKNTLFSTDSLIGTSGALVGPAFATTFTGPAPTSNPFSLTQVLTLSTSGATSFSGDFDLNLVPEPASVALLGGALLLTMTAIRRKFRRS